VRIDWGNFNRTAEEAPHRKLSPDLPYSVVDDQE